MLDADTRRKLTDLMQKHFTDLDIERDEPFKFRSGKWLLVLETVRLLEHHRFLMDMFSLIITYKQIFFNVDFLASHNLKDAGEIKRLTDQVLVFQANTLYEKFIKDSLKFISEWGYVCRIRGENVGKMKRNPRQARKVLEQMTPDTFIYVLFLVFVRNYDIVKKNMLGFLHLFQPDGMNSPMGTSSPSSKKQAQQMPKYSRSPYPKEILEVFVQQSKMH